MPALRTSARCGLWGALLLALAYPVSAAPVVPGRTAVTSRWQFQTWLTSGSVSTTQGVFTSGQPWKFVEPDGTLHHFQAVRLLRPFESEPVTTQIAPRWQFLLPGGERLTGELASDFPPGHRQAWHLRLRMHAEEDPLVRTCSPESLRGMVRPDREIPLLYDDFESAAPHWTRDGQPLPPQAGPHRSGTRSLAIPAGKSPVQFRISEFPAWGRIQWQMHEGDPANLSARHWRISFHYAPRERETSAPPHPAPPAFSWHVESDAATYRVATPPDWKLQPFSVPRKAGWRQWSLQFTPRQTVLVVDGLVLGAGPSLRGLLESMQFSCSSPSPRNAATDSGMALDDMLVLQGGEFSPRSLPALRHTQSQDLVRLQSGEELFGTIAAVDSQQLSLRQRHRTRALPLFQVQALLQRSVLPEPRFAPTEGYHALIELTAGLWDSNPAPDRVCVALKPPGTQPAEIASPALVEAEHSLLGTLRFPWREIERIEPLFHGRRWLLVAGPRHVGGAVRDDFSVPLPQGAPLAHTFTLEKIPPGNCFCSLLVEDLEPAGTHTPETSPTLSTLQAGHLQTRLLVNGRVVAELNRLISQRARPGFPERLRCPLPAAALRIGKNIVSLEQTSAADDPQRFDDFQFSQFALEWEYPE